MEPEAIRMELFRRRKKANLSSIAKELGCSRQAVAAVIERKFVSNRIMVAVAEAIERDPKYVFSEYFLKKAI